jgi:hypothetical protein
MMAAILIALVSLVISLITFSLQFIAHDRLAYLLSNVTTTFWPNNVYYTVSLSVFNNGNRPVALISATADLVETKIENRQQAVTDADCVTSPTSKVVELFAAPPGNDTPVNAAVYQYGTAIDAGKLVTANLVFRRFGDDTPRNETVEGVACLRLLFADATETRYAVSRALTGVFVAFPDQSTEKTLAAGRSSVPSLVVDDKRLELPF